MRDLTTTSQGTFGLPPGWKFDYPWSMVKIGFWLWMVSGFERLPTQQEVMAYDPRWITDMQLAYQVYSFYKTQSPLFEILRQSEENEGEIDFKARREGGGEVPMNGKNYNADADMGTWEMLMKQAKAKEGRKK